MKFPANTASEFIANATKKFGGNTLGETTPKFAWKFGSFKDGKMAKVEFTLSIDVVWAEAGSGSPDADNKAAIRMILISASHFIGGRSSKPARAASRHQMEVI